MRLYFLGEWKKSKAKKRKVGQIGSDWLIGFISLRNLPRYNRVVEEDEKGSSTQIVKFLHGNQVNLVCQRPCLPPPPPTPKLLCRLKDLCEEG